MADLIVAQAKEKEFKRLADYVLNLMSEIEVGLNPNSIGRNPYSRGKAIIYAPLKMEVEKLNTAFLELRDNILTPEEKELLSEKKKLLK